jgi:hypothetical protein
MQVLLVEGIQAGVDSLEGHVAARRTRPGWRDVELMAMAACSYAGKGVDEATVRKAAEQLCKVCFTVWSWFDQVSYINGLNQIDPDKCFQLDRRGFHRGMCVHSAYVGNDEPLVSA